MSDSEKLVLEPTSGADKNMSLIVVADTHFGLKKKTQRCEPFAFSDFLKWIRKLELGGKETVDFGVWALDKKTLSLEPPEKVVFLGDALELWDASPESIDASTRYIAQLLFDLDCQKVYVLGNHDHELSEIVGDYPSRALGLSVTDKEVTVSKGGENYLLLHGQQFDSLFALPSWQFMSPIRKAAMAFGSYSWVFVILFILDLVFGAVAGFKTAFDILALALLGAVSIPFLIVKFGRDVWNRLKTAKYKPVKAEVNVEAWWSKYVERNKLEGQDWNVVFGHTHVIDFWRRSYADNLLSVWNIPSWVKDNSESKGIKFEQVFRNAFLYIDEENCEFFGWDTDRKKPFLIPKDLVVEKRENGDLMRLEMYKIEDELRKIGWPQELIDKWMRFNPL